MAITVKADLVAQSQAGQTLQETVVTRVFQVSGLSAYAPSSVVPQALGAAGVPRLGDRHPDPIFDNLIVVETKTDIDPSYDVVNVYITYRWRNFLGTYLKSVSGSLREIQRVMIDPNTGDPINVTYTATDGTSISVPCLFKYQLLDGIISFRFLETLDPEYFNMNWSNFTNSAYWRGYAPRTLKILPMSGSTQDNYFFDNTYNIQYKSDTYDQYAIYQDQFGVTPIEVLNDISYDGRTSGNGWARVAVDPQVDFNILFNQLPQLAPNAYGLELGALLGGR